MNNHLISVLEIIIDDRKKYPWAKSLGIGGGATSRLFKEGVMPADRHLRKIMKSENASMSALWGASVAPFMVHRTGSTTESYEILKQHFEDSSWTINVISGDEFPIVVLSCAAQDLIDGTEFNYKRVEIVCGPMDHACANLFKEQVILHKELDEEEAHKIATGYRGTYYLFGKNTLEDSSVITYQELLTIFREKSNLNAQVLNRVLEIIDETILEEKAEVTPEEKRKLATQLYSYALEEGLIPEDVSENLAHSMLKVL